MMKILATVAVLSLSMTGVSLAQDSGSGSGSGSGSSSGGQTTGSQTDSSGDDGSAGTAAGSGNGASSGGEAPCPAGQKPADNYTTADPKCVAE
jgi:hypothetical protein